MGHYTQFRFKAKMKEIPKPLYEIIDNHDDYWEELWEQKPPTSYNISQIPDLPIDHEFGKCTRWYMLLFSNNFDSRENTGSKIEGDILTISSEFKNYDDEIDRFVDWIVPFCEEIFFNRSIYIG